MKDYICDLFSGAKGQKIYSDFERAINDFNMQPLLTRGVLLGFSGGADSVILLCLLCAYSKKNGNFPIVAMHINHMIRGEESLRDEEFSKKFANELGIEFISKRIDIPSIAKTVSTGIEETARNERYSAFADIISSRNDILTIATAHNATDNLETVVLNMMRGSGTKGLSGIMPVRQNIVRPLIYSAKSDILDCLDSSKIPYVNDSTNSSVEYSRNYVRHEILPKFLHFSANPEKTFTRLSAALRTDSDCLDELADEFLKTNLISNKILADSLSKLHVAIRSRAIIRFIKQHTDAMPEFVHLSKISELLGSGDFSVSLPGGVSFICEDGFCRIGKLENSSTDFYLKLNYGINHIVDTPIKIFISDFPIEKTFTNVYKIAIQRSLYCDIIDNDIYVRSKKDGDAYVYGGITHKLKKLFNDKSIPPSLRSSVPIICDKNGILWVPGFGCRDEAVKTASTKKIHIAILIKENEDIENLFKKLSSR